MKSVTLVRLAFLIVATSAVGACSSGTRSGGSGVEGRNELIARRVMAAWESADTATLVDLFAPNAVYDDFPNQQQYHGIQEIVGHILDVQTWATNISMDVADVHTGPTSAVAEWTLSGVQDRPLGDFAPTATNREFVLNGVTIFETANGRITRAADYWDTAPLVLQLGGKIVLPGGGVWKQNRDSTGTAGTGGGSD